MTDHPPLETYTLKHWCTPGCPQGCDVDEVQVWHAERVVKRRALLTEDELAKLRQRVAESRAMTSAQIVARQKRERREKAETAAARLRGER